MLKEDVMRCVRFTGLAFVPLVVAAYAAPASAEDISGTIAVTKVIVEDSQLVGNVTCTMTTTQCIQLGAPNIALRLNGFIITGPANPDDTTTCQATSGPPLSDGISNGTSAANSQPGVQIIGPGMVQKFRRHGISSWSAGVSTHVTVKGSPRTTIVSAALATGMTDMRSKASSRSATPPFRYASCETASSTATTITS
jgi:hypothetical protein